MDETLNLKPKEIETFSKIINELDFIWVMIYYWSFFSVSAFIIFIIIEFKFDEEEN